jgi:hypothetical protein
MENNGKYRFFNQSRAFSDWKLLFVCALVCVLAGGCRGSRSLVQETATAEHREYESHETYDSVSGEGSSNIHQREGSQGSTRESGHIDIRRDSSGRPILIYWVRNFDFKGYGESRLDSKDLFKLRSSSGSSDSSGSVDSINKETEETEEEINPSIPLETLIGSSLLLLGIFYVLFVIIGDHLWPWIRQRLK